MIRLSHDTTELEILPELGGAIGRLRYGGRDLLRPTPEGAADVLQAACFPLVPFCNRIRDGHFVFGGHEVQMAPNLGDHPHTLHGQGWRAVWTVDEQTLTRARLSYRHQADEWPWDYEATQVFELGAKRLRIGLSVRNLSASPMPAGLGFHPYFNRTDRTRLRAQVSGVWLSDADCLPVEWLAGRWEKDWRNGDQVTHERLIDHCHTGFSGWAEIYEGERPVVSLRASADCRWLHIYIPPGEEFFCVEPVNHLPDPFNHANSGLQGLKPDEVAAVWMELSIA